MPFSPETSDKTVLEDNLDLCMHLLNGTIPLQNRREVPIEIVDVEDVVRSHFERLAQVRYIYSPYQFLIYYFCSSSLHSLSLLGFPFFFFQLVREDMAIERMVW